MEHTDIATRYAKEVVSGKRIAGKKVMQACERHLRDLDRQSDDEFGYIYLPDVAEKVVQFMEILPDITTGKPVSLAVFQKFITYSLYGWYHKKNHDLRRFNKALISMARKNGKSFLISGPAIYELIAGKSPAQNRQIYCTAQSREQASIVFNMVVQRLDSLMSQSKAISDSLRRVRNEINHLPSYSVLKPLSKDTGNLNGLAPSLSILDEYGASTTNEMMEVLESGAVLQENALTLIISTAYFDLNSPMYADEYKHGEKILKQEVDQDNYFVMVYEQDDESEIYDESLWIKSNPLLEVDEIKEILVRNLRNRFDEMVSKDNMLGLIVKNFNMWKQGSENTFLPVKEWSACEGGPIDIHGKDVYLGIDLSRVNDLTAVSSIYPISDTKFYVDNHSFVATTGGLEKKSQRDKIDYELLINKGYATASRLKSGFIDFVQVIEYIEELIISNNLNVIAIAYDPHMMEKFIPEWERKFDGTDLMDVPFVEVGQSFMNLSEPIKDFQLQVYERNIIHSNNPNLNIAVNNAVIRYDNNRNVILDKQKAREMIDPLVALVTAWAEAMNHEYKEMDMKQLEQYILSDDFGF